MSNKQQEAETLARIIRAYWTARGRSPLVWVERQEVTASATDARAVYVVRSDMVGGRPRTFPAISKPTLKIVSGVKSDSPSPFAALAGMGQRQKAIKPHGPSNRIWREPGIGAA